MSDIVKLSDLLPSKIPKLKFKEHVGGGLYSVKLNLLSGGVISVKIYQLNVPKEPNTSSIGLELFSPPSRYGKYPSRKWAAKLYSINRLGLYSERLEGVDPRYVNSLRLPPGVTEDSVSPLFDKVLRKLIPLFSFGGLSEDSRKECEYAFNRVKKRFIEKNRKPSRHRVVPRRLFIRRPRRRLPRA